jgi:signal transduction histidine kinase
VALKSVGALRSWALRPHLPRRTVRLRLTLLYGALFLVCGAALLGLTFALVHASSGAAVATIKQAVGTQSGGAQRSVTIKGGSSVMLPGGRIIVLPPGLTDPQVRAQARQVGVVAESVSRAYSHQLLVWSLVGLGVMAVVSLGLGWVMAGRILSRLSTIIAAARTISASSLDQRLAFAGPNDEFKELGDTFDDLLARLEAAFAAQRQFVANASHELRTPLARQRTVAQVALADPDATVESLRKAHERVLAAGAQQERLLEALLTLTRGQAGLERREPFDLAILTDQVLLARQPEVRQRGLEITSALSPATAVGDSRLVERLIANLVDNALRHNVDHGRVEVTTHDEEGYAVLTVSNTGPVVPPDAVERLFAPFQRLDDVRTAAGEDLGLGLSIVRAIATAHEATVSLTPNVEGGLTAEVGFPVVDPASGPVAGAS